MVCADPDPGWLSVPATANRSPRGYGGAAVRQSIRVDRRPRGAELTPAERLVPRGARAEHDDGPFGYHTRSCLSASNSDLDDTDVGGAVRGPGSKRLSSAVRSAEERPPRDGGHLEPVNVARAIGLKLRECLDDVC
jgi:hypothetical protein